MNQARQIAKILLESEAVVLRPSDPFRFASGILSPIYCDNRIILSSVSNRKDVLASLVENAKSFSPEAIAGVATAGISWGAWVADALNLPFSYVRAKAKEHGKGKRIEGKATKGQKTLLVEDLVSTGGSVLSAAEALREEGVNVAGAICIFTYHFADAKAAFTKANVELKNATSLSELLDEATQSQRISEGEREMVERWQNDPKNWG